MNSPETTLVYACPDSIYWVKDSTRIIVVDEQSRQVQLLTGVETAVWDWLMLGYDYSRLAGLTAVLLDIPLTQAKQHLHHQLQAWQQRGLLTVHGGIDG